MRKAIGCDDGWGEFINFLRATRFRYAAAVNKPNLVFRRTVRASRSAPLWIAVYMRLP
ncbi:MAG TPA: hypothetical protein VI136_00870 [Verrucomicrobiae bacterium]